MRKRKEIISIAHKRIQLQLSQHSYAGVLSEIRAGVKPEESEIEVRQIRKTFLEGNLLELNRSNDRGKFENAQKLVAGEKANIETLTTNLKSQLFAMERVKIEKEIKASIIQNYAEQVREMKVFISYPNKKRKGVVALTEDPDRKMLQEGRIIIGLRYIRVRNRIELKRC